MSGALNLVEQAVDPDALVNTRVMARILSMHPETVADWARRKKIPSYTFGGKTRRFRPSEVLAALGVAVVT